MQEWIQMKINWNIYKKGGTAHKGSYVQYHQNGFEIYFEVKYTHNME